TSELKSTRQSKILDLMENLKTASEKEKKWISTLEKLKRPLSDLKFSKEEKISNFWILLNEGSYPLKVRNLASLFKVFTTMSYIGWLGSLSLLLIVVIPVSMGN